MSKKKNIHPYYRLGCDCVKQFAEDYINAVGTGKEEELEEIARSGFLQLFDIDPDAFIEKIRREYTMVTQEQKDRIVALRAEGKPYNQIAEAVGVSYTTVNRTLRESRAAENAAAEEVPAVDDKPSAAEEATTEEITEVPAAYNVKAVEETEHPSYYRQNGVEAIDVIDAFELNFNLGNVIKYILRAGRKTSDRKADLRKAAFYLAREIEKA